MFVRSSSNRRKLGSEIVTTLSSLSGIVLLAFFTIIVFSVIVLVEDTYKDKLTTKATHGKLDLSRLDLNSSYAIPLNGQWSFYWQKLYSPQTAKQNLTDAVMMPMPSAWADSTQDYIHTTGYATYHLSVELNQQYPELAISLPVIGTSYLLFINGEKIAHGGQVGKTAEESQAYYNPGLFMFKPNSKHLDITLQVANFDFQWGGTWQAIRLGTPDSLIKQENAKKLRSVFLIAVFITVCIFNLIQYSLQPEQKVPLIITFIAASLALREIGESQILHLSGLYFFSFKDNVLINFLTFTAAVPLYIQYFKSQFPSVFKASITRLINTVAIIYSLYILFSSPLESSKLMPYFQYFMMPAILYLSYALVKAVIKKLKNASLLFIGSFILFTFVFNDLLHSLHIIDSLSLTSFGLVSFLMCQNYLMYSDFINASIENQRLNIVLEDKNKDLLEFSKTLEEKVEERTHELGRVNQKLERLVNEDPLTGLLNRRGLMIQIQMAHKALKKHESPFCLLILDFDHFKRLNDKLGHDIGDIVLENGGQLMKENCGSFASVGRWGGEEFMILFSETKISQAFEHGESIRKAINQQLSAQINTNISVTMGLAEYSYGESIDDCIKRADLALYEGKQQGRNRLILAA